VRASAAERLWGRVDKDGAVSAQRPDLGACWLWLGGVDTQGYGRLRWDGREIGTHRIVWMVLVGPIPEGLTLDHLCRVRHCVNPLHLEPVTLRVNQSRGQGASARSLRGETCPRGHTYGSDNVMPSVAAMGKRTCRACKLIREHLRYQKRRADPAIREDLRLRSRAYRARVAEAHILRKRYRRQPWAEAAAAGPETEAELRYAFGDR